MRKLTKVRDGQKPADGRFPQRAPRIRSRPDDSCFIRHRSGQGFLRRVTEPGLYEVILGTAAAEFDRRAMDEAGKPPPGVAAAAVFARGIGGAPASCPEGVKAETCVSRNYGFILWVRP
ncbi:MAG: hypothetical protein LBW85_00740 [Deltaproteobacteria bacterium]|jgi:hypothetical protein|nr:hypothetical protein [Deltaproteobacteria bacterium]